MEYANTVTAEPILRRHAVFNESHARLWRVSDLGTVTRQAQTYSLQSALDASASDGHLLDLVVRALLTAPLPSLAASLAAGRAELNPESLKGVHAHAQAQKCVCRNRLLVLGSGKGPRV